MDMRVHFSLAVLIRLSFLAIGYVLDSHSKVKYTDVDYQVFTDASLHVTAGQSPFTRPTYRYTPFLAFILTPNILIHKSFGKLLFCLFDILTSILIYDIQRRSGFSPEQCKTSTLLWLYNPLPVIISTRGNAESLMTFLVALCVMLHRSGRPLLLGFVYGMAVHFKIYPCIYAMSFYFALPSEVMGGRFRQLVWPSKPRILFVTSSAIGFLAPAAISTYLYPGEYFKEALMYHLVRKDIRHNFSPYFYVLYLLESQNGDMMSSFVSSSAFVLQALLMLLASMVLVEPRTLPACMFMQTFLFVSFNKVCTSQYFVWYLFLLPMSYPLVEDNAKFAKALLAWMAGQAAWLLPAYYLEFKGNNTFSLIFVASLLFFAINIYLVCLFIKPLMISSNVCTEKKSKEIKVE